MGRIHPTESKLEGRERSRCSSVWTVWKKSSMAFQGTDGFSVYNSEGELAFRLDNYSRKHKELVLMNGAGKPLLTLRPQVGSKRTDYCQVQGLFPACQEELSPSGRIIHRSWEHVSVQIDSSSIRVHDTDSSF